ncbi:hypothetical protein PGAL8A_00375500 [Plasmodium gallinaceum]|uniref:Uncharacterized protein n=1 Tax=Plasmodium gallinaceum TaxID=5849 RepID=A0A1J1GVN5_PLAGA|nr:hypothetical protein PGAL8A_00375500 [Plasmodium gallinaceum]CRG96530.1 hypothetical protein PGAL8A_00375500 [Plasmodium gallinaceum]
MNIIIKKIYDLYLLFSTIKMNISKKLIFNLLLIFNLIGFLFNDNFSSSSLNNVLLVRNHELREIKRNLAEMIPSTSSEYEKKSNDGAEFGPRRFIDVYVQAEADAFLELLDTLRSNYEKKDETINEMDSLLRSINSRFSSEGIKLSFDGLMDVHKRVAERAMFYVSNSTPQMFDLLRNIIQIESQICIEILQTIINEDKIIDEEIVKYNEVISALQGKIEESNLSLIDVKLKSIALRIHDFIECAVSVYNSRFANAVVKNENYVNGYIGIEKIAMDNIFNYICNVCGRKCTEVYHNPKFVLNTIYELYLKNNLTLSFEQVENIYTRIRKRITYLSKKRLTKKLILHIDVSYSVEFELAKLYTFQALQSTSDENEQKKVENVDKIRRMTEEKLRSHRSQIEGREIGRMAGRIQQIVFDIVS